MSATDPSKVLEALIGATVEEVHVVTMSVGGQEESQHHDSDTLWLRFRRPDGEFISLSVNLSGLPNDTLELHVGIWAHNAWDAPDEPFDPIESAHLAAWCAASTGPAAGTEPPLEGASTVPVTRFAYKKE